MGTFKTLEGTGVEIDKELNILAENNHVKIVSSNAVVISEEKGNAIPYIEHRIVNIAHIYYTPKKKETT